MSVDIGDEIMLMPRELGQPVRAGEIREIRDGPGGVLYLVRWSDTGYESLLRPGPDTVIEHRHGQGKGTDAAADAPWLSRLLHPLAWQHSRDHHRKQQARDQLLAWRVQKLFGQLGLSNTDLFTGNGRHPHLPEVVSVTPGPR